MSPLTMRHLSVLLLLLLLPPSSFFCHCLPDSEKMALVQLKEILENPAALSDWGWQTDFCNLQPTAAVKVLCEGGGGGGRVSHLQIAGNRAAASGSGSPSSAAAAAAAAASGGGAAASRQLGKLSERFSSEALILHLTNFTSLTVLELTSLGLWGPLPSKLGRLQYLETLDLSSNFFSGVIPNRLTSLRRLHRLSLAANSLDGSLPPRWSAAASLSSVSLANNRLHGPLPPSIFSDIPSLSVLIVDNNSFSGSLPLSLASAAQLQFLSVSGNHLSGELPDLAGLSSLQALDLHGNKLGPGFPSLPPQLLLVSLSRNQFRGPVPASVASLVELRQLDLSYNLFSGVAPPVLFGLPRLVRLDLARNRLTGTLSPNLTLSRRLTELDFSFNLISGPLPAAVESLIDGGDRVRFQWNCLSTKRQPQNPFSYCQNAALASGLDIGQVASAKELRRGRNGGGGAAAVAGIVVAVLLGFAAVSLLLFFGIVRWQRRRRNALEGGESGDDGGRKLAAAAAGGGGVDHKSVMVSSEIFSSARYISRTRKLGGLGWPQFRVYAPEEIYKATCCFDESMLIGDGGHGRVFKGELEDGTAIAVKVVREEEEEEVGGGSLKVLKAHVEHLGKFRHKHLVALLGYAIIINNVDDEDEEAADDDGDLQKKKKKKKERLDGGGGGGGCRMYLVYEYVDGTTLRAKLAEEAFGWTHRLQAIIGAAKALHFLHSGLVPGVFDNNVTSNNVLLDHNSVSKLSDFGLSIRRRHDDIAQHNNNNSVRNLLHAEKNRKEGVGDKTDVYNFGLILLEALIGKVPCIQALESLLFSEQEPRRLDAILDPLVLASCNNNNNNNVESLQTVVDITVKCLCKDPKGRPSMEDVLWNLQYAFQVLQNAGAGAGEHPAVDDDDDGVLFSDHHPKAVLLAGGGKRRRKTLVGGGGGSCRIYKMSSNDEVGKPSSPNTEFLR